MDLKKRCQYDKIDWHHKKHIRFFDFIIVTSEYAHNDSENNLNIDATLKHQLHYHPVKWLIHKKKIRHGSVHIMPYTYICIYP